MDKRWRSACNGIITAMVMNAALLAVIIFFSFFIIFMSIFLFEGALQFNGESIFRHFIGLMFFGLFGAMIGIAALVLLLVSLSRFAEVQGNDKDKSQILLLRNAYIVGVAGGVVGSLIGEMPGVIVMGLAQLATIIMMIVAFNGYSKSEVLNELALKGARQLRIASILMLGSIVLFLVPGLNMILPILAFVFMLLGWFNVRDGGLCRVETEVE